MARDAEVEWCQAALRRGLKIEAGAMRVAALAEGYELRDVREGDWRRRRARCGWFHFAAGAVLLALMVMSWLST